MIVGPRNGDGDGHRPAGPARQWRRRKPPQQQVMEYDSQEIRVCALVLSVLAFFLFIAAELVPSSEPGTDTRNVVMTLVAMGTLGFAWIGPLTLLAGTMKSPRFKWWQPFQGGTEFVWMQAFGWSLHTLVITASIVVLANKHMEKWVEGQYLLLGVSGFAGQLLLNLSIGCFDEHAVEEPVLQFPWNTKAVVSMLVSGSGALLYVGFDLFALRLKSTIILSIGCAEFGLSAFTIHVLYGCREVPGYRIWQPFEGERMFLLLQYLGWQFFAGTIAGTMLLYSGTDFAQAQAYSRGAPTAVGVMGVISQVLLLLSLQQFRAQPTPGANGVVAADGRRRRPREVYVSALLCAAALILGSVSYVARIPERTLVASPQVWAAFRREEKVSWAIGIFALAIAAPIVNMGAVREVPGYQWWQPFLGGTKYVFLQTLGWLWYAFFLAASIVLCLNDARFADITASFVLLLGCASTGAIVLSISYFKAPGPPTLPTTTTTPPPSPDTGLPSASMGAAANRVLSYETTAQQGEIAISLLLTVSAIICHFVADYLADVLTSSLRHLTLAIATALFVLGCGIVHATGRRFYPEYRFLQPFEGGSRFVVRQAVGWTLFAVQLLFDALLASLPPRSLPFGVVSLAGMFALIPHLVLLTSIRYFRPLLPTTISTAPPPTPPTTVAVTTTTTPAGLNTQPATAPTTRFSISPAATPRFHFTEVSWTTLTVRPELRWRLLVNLVVIAGTVLLFVAAEFLHQSARFRGADVVLYAFGFVLSIGSILFTHCVLGPRARPGYRFFQPFRGGLKFITYQGVAWTLASVAWAIASMALYWHGVFFQFPAIHVLTGTLFFVAQAVMVYSIPFFKPPQLELSECPELLSAHMATLDRFAHEFFIGPLLGMAACTVFVLVDLAMIYCGPSLPVLPITVCAVCALFSAIPLSYKFARSSMGAQAKAIGGSVIFLVLGSALWSFTILLGAMFCLRIWGMESANGGDRTMSPLFSSSSGGGAFGGRGPGELPSSTNFMGTFTGSVGFAAQFVFFQASELKARPPTPESSPDKGRSRALRAVQRAREHLVSASIWLYSMALVITGIIYAYITSFLPRHLPTHQLLGMTLCSLFVIGCACWIQRQIVMTGGDVALELPSDFIPLQDAALVRLEAECFAQLATFLTVADLIRMLSTCRGFQMAQREPGFWHREFMSRFGQLTVAPQPPPSLGRARHVCCRVDRTEDIPMPSLATPFAATWLNAIESTLLTSICRLDFRDFGPMATFADLVLQVNQSPWKTLCISRSVDFHCGQCGICGRLDILPDTAWEWERGQGCNARVPSTWITLCACVDPTLRSLRLAHRQCLEGLDRDRRVIRCGECHAGVQVGRRYPMTVTELVHVTWADFRMGREDFGEGFFAFVPMSVAMVVISANAMDFGGVGLYVWVAFAMSLCFVANSPRFIQSVIHLGEDEESPSYAAYERLFQALMFSSAVHVLWCLSDRSGRIGFLDLVLGLNFVGFLILASTLLLMYWRMSYELETVDSAASTATIFPERDDEFEAAAANDEPPGPKCVGCLLQLCSSPIASAT